MMNFYLENDEKYCFLTSYICTCNDKENELYKRCLQRMDEKNIKFLPQKTKEESETLRQQQLQEYFNALFIKEEFQKLIEELIIAVKDYDITYDNIIYQFYQHISCNSPRYDLLTKVISVIKENTFSDKKVCNFTKNIKKWSDFTVYAVEKFLSNDLNQVTILETQKDFIYDYCNSLCTGYEFLNGIKEESADSVSYPIEIYYFCFFQIILILAMVKRFICH